MRLTRDPADPVGSSQARPKRTSISIRDLALAAASGALVGLAMPRASLHFLIWLAFVPLLYAVEAKNRWASFRLGFITGVVGYASGFYWIAATSARFFDLSVAGAAAVLAAFLFWHALHPALFAALVCGLRHPVLASGLRFDASVLFPALAWVAVEGFFPMLIPWRLGLVLQPHVPMLQLAEITGVAGLSFAIILVNTLLACAFRRRSDVGSFFRLAATALAVLLALEIFGIGRLRSFGWEMGDGRSIALLQGNMPATRVANADFVDDSLRIYSTMSLAVAPQRPDLIVWPEAALRQDPMIDPSIRARLFEVAARTNAMLLAGASGPTDGGGQTNRALLASPYGDFIGHYEKTRPFPFAEHMPWPFTGLSPGGLTPGSKVPVFLLPGTRFAPSICYEVFFSRLFRDAVLDGAELLVNITNDVWFGDTSAPQHHLQAAVMRAVETRRWLVRSANSGISAVISPTGRVVAQTRVFERDTLVGRIALRRGETLYTRWGDWFTYGCAGAALLLIVTPVYWKTYNEP